jgi:hypothetical protein
MDARLNRFSNQTAGKMLKYCEYAPPPPGRECLSGTLVLTMTATAAALLDDPSDRASSAAAGPGSLGPSLKNAPI